MRDLNLLDPSLGIQNVMNMPEAGQLPQARQLAANVLNSAGLEDLYGAVNARRLVEQALCPDVGDGEMLRPAKFAGLLEGCVKDLAGNTDPAVQELVAKELKPLLENRELLGAYMGLMIGG